MRLVSCSRTLPALLCIVALAGRGRAADASNGDAGGGPHLKVDTTDFYFGKVPDSRAVEHVFIVSNTGSKPLVITRVQTSCGCTAAMMESSVVDAGQSGKLRVSFNPRGQRGSVSRSVSLYSNDESQPVVQLKISADVSPPDEVMVAVAPFTWHHTPREKSLVFKAACDKCHAPRGEPSGEKLYVQVCAMCHGEARQGVKVGTESLGPALTLATMTVKSAAGIRQVVAAGTGHPFMPGFGKEYGGPLSDRQLDSLVALITASSGKKN